MDKEIFLNLYKSMVRLHIEYATQVWSPQYKKDKITLENVKRRATRLVKCINHLSHSERLKRVVTNFEMLKGTCQYVSGLQNSS